VRTTLKDRLLDLLCYLGFHTDLYREPWRLYNHGEIGLILYSRRQTCLRCGHTWTVNRERFTGFD
jgi:Fe-S oxidoreductase